MWVIVLSSSGSFALVTNSLDLLYAINGCSGKSFVRVGSESMWLQWLHGEYFSEVLPPRTVCSHKVAFIRSFFSLSSKCSGRLSYVISMSFFFVSSGGYPRFCRCVKRLSLCLSNSFSLFVLLRNSKRRHSPMAIPFLTPAG